MKYVRCRACDCAVSVQEITVVTPDKVTLRYVCPVCCRCTESLVFANEPQDIGNISGPAERDK